MNNTATALLRAGAFAASFALGGTLAAASLAWSPSGRLGLFIAPIREAPSYGFQLLPFVLVLLAASLWSFSNVLRWRRGGVLFPAAVGWVWVFAGVVMEGVHC